MTMQFQKLVGRKSNNAKSIKKHQNKNASKSNIRNTCKLWRETAFYQIEVTRFLIIAHHHPKRSLTCLLLAGRTSKVSSSWSGLQGADAVLISSKCSNMRQ